MDKTGSWLPSILGSPKRLAGDVATGVAITTKGGLALAVGSLLVGTAGGLAAGYGVGKGVAPPEGKEHLQERIKTQELRELKKDLMMQRHLDAYKRGYTVPEGSEIHV